MAGVQAKRLKIEHYLDTHTTGSAAAWSRLGHKVAASEIAYNPVTEETYDITMDNTITEITGYKRSMAIEGVVYPGDDVFDYIDTMRINMAVLESLQTEMVNVWAYKASINTGTEILPVLEWPAEKVKVTIGIESIGGEGGPNTAKIKYTIYDAGDPVKGTFEPVLKVFTAAT
jgi:hypothetical protein